MKHIYYFTYYNISAPSIRYRAIYVLEKLRAEYNYTYDFVYPSYKPKEIFNFLRVFFSILIFRKKNSTIVFQKIYTRRIYATALKILLHFHPENTIYDIDDAEYENYPPHTINHFLANSSSVSVGSHTLLNYAGQFNQNVTILTSPVVAHSQFKSGRNDVFTIGWIGFYNAHQHNLRKLFFPALKNVNFPIRLVLLGVTKPEHMVEIKGYFSSNSNVILEIPEDIDWQDELSIYKRIKQFDIGISPLLNTEINRAKSAFKLKQYLSCGVPVLASNIGENSIFLKDGINGYFCKNAAEYLEKILLVRDMTDASYSEMQKHALDTVSSFSIKTYCYALMNLLPKSEFHPTNLYPTPRIE